MSGVNHILVAGENGGTADSRFGSFVVARAGCKMDNIIRELYSSKPDSTPRDSTQRRHGAVATRRNRAPSEAARLVSDAIVGAVASVNSSQVLCVGRVPN